MNGLEWSYASATWLEAHGYLPVDHPVYRLGFDVGLLRRVPFDDGIEYITDIDRHVAVLGEWSEC